MAIEIERKFLVRSEGWRGAITASQRLRQGYLADAGHVTLRVRIVDDATAVLTIKAGRVGRSRSEYEYGIPVPDAEELLALCGERHIEKTRYLVPAAGLASGDGRHWEVDEYAGRHKGLVVAELELSDENEHFARPGWLGREVTDDGRYTNAALAEAGVPASE